MEAGAGRWASARREGRQEVLVAGVEVTLTGSDLLVGLPLARLPRWRKEPRLVGRDRGKSAHSDRAVLIDGEFNFVPGAYLQSLADFRRQCHLVPVAANACPARKNRAHDVTVSQCHRATRHRRPALRVPGRPAQGGVPWPGRAGRARARAPHSVTMTGASSSWSYTSAASASVTAAARAAADGSSSPVRSARRTRITATVTIRASTAIPAATRNPREIPTARAWCSTAAGGVPPALAAGTGWPARAAAAAAWATWCLMLFDTALQVTVPSAARPIAPPTCWPVFSRLEATPESSPRTRVSATSDSGTNSMPRPAEVTSMGPSRPLADVVCSLMCENQYIPPAVTAPPGSLNRRAPVADTRCVPSPR